MARCVNCGMEVDVEWESRGYFKNSDGDFVCSKSCDKSDTARSLRAADLPYNPDDITFTSKRRPYDPWNV